MKRICFVGASTTEGMGDRTGKGWVGNTSLAREQHAVCFNLGVRGQTIFQIAERAGAECKARIIDNSQGGIVLGCALNELARLDDGTPRCDFAEVKSCYLALIRELSEIAPTVVVGAPPVLHEKMPFFSAASGLSLDFRNPDIENHDKTMNAICAGLGVAYIPVYPELAQNELYQSGLVENDGLHTNAEGYRAMAMIVEASSHWKSFTN